MSSFEFVLRSQSKPHFTRRSLRRILALAITGFVLPAYALAPGQPGTVLTIPASGLGDTAYAGALDPDGGIVVGGSAKSGGAGALARVTATGSIDTGFGTSMSGVFAVGDVSNRVGPTISGATGSGATAAKMIASRLNAK